MCRAVPCRAVPCRAVPCRAVPCRAVPCRRQPPPPPPGGALDLAAPGPEHPPRQSYSSATSFRGTPNWPGMSLQLPCHQVVPRRVAASSDCSRALSPASAAEAGPACIPPAPSSALPHLCILAKALLQSQSCAVSLEAERFPPGVSSGGWSRLTAPQALDVGWHFPSLSLTPHPLHWAWEGMHWWLKLELGDWGVGSGSFHVRLHNSLESQWDCCRARMEGTPLCPGKVALAASMKCLRMWSCPLAAAEDDVLAQECQRNTTAPHIPLTGGTWE
ncbi:uncharacterized protein LOC128811903 [Vidua macroura]|uniref:uncharacterized protein LOC128811903 n=1 Tax=Vidua macroura TaxID=187451 RepID=UPI0023A7B240|nr:uncharacterized protein LOC128811903 [Vidua macroura]